MIKIKNLAEKAEIYIYGMILDDTDASWLIRDSNGEIGYQWPAKIKSELEEIGEKPIDVHIASDGGDVAAGIAISNMLTAHKSPVNVYIDSWAASIASFIAFCGNKIFMPSNTFLMIHNPKAGAFGQADYLISVANWLTKIRDMLAETYSKKAKEKSIDEIKKLMDAETWITAEEAVNLFSNVELLEPTDMKAVACNTTFKNAPKELLERSVENTEKPKNETETNNDNNNNNDNDNNNNDNDIENLNYIKSVLTEAFKV